MLSKPCGRAAKGCRRIIYERWPKRLARRVFCSPECAQADKVENGQWPASNQTGVSKPCRRADRGCQGLVRARGPKTLAKKRYCSSRCACLYRQEHGLWHHPTLTRADRRRGGRRGGRASGMSRRIQRMTRTVARIAQLIPTDMRRELSPVNQRRLKVLLALAWQDGRKSKNPRTQSDALVPPQET